MLAMPKHHLNQHLEGRNQHFPLPNKGATKMDEACTSSSSSTYSGYIRHPVSKLDTLAGIAIKYGVEVADIKRANGLVTDIQMFAHKILKIPLPGRHPATTLQNREMERSSTPILVRHAIHNAKTQRGLSTKLNLTRLNRKNPEKRPVSLAMNLLRGYYGLYSPAHSENEGTEMVLYSSSDNRHCANDSDVFLSSTKSQDLRVLGKDWPACINSINGNHTLGKPERAECSISLDEAILENVSENIVASNIEKLSDRSVRRRSKVDEGTCTTRFSGVGHRQQRGVQERSVICKSPLSRPKFMQKASITDTHSLAVQPFIISSHTDGSSDGSNAKGLISKVKRSSSTPSLQEEKSFHANSGSNYGCKLELTSLSQASFNLLGPRPLFEGLSKPIGIRWNKAALD